MADVMYKPAAIWRCCLLVVAAVTIAPAVAKDKSKTSVADLRYGVALYNYYQQDYMSALAELMVADTRDGIQGHGDNPELIAGGVSLAFGMQHHAEAVFNNILQDERRPQAVRDAAWFYLGKLHYTRGDWIAAEQSFARVSNEFKPALRAQMHALQINIRQKSFSDITSKNIDADVLRSWSPFALYNLGAAHARSGDFKTAQVFFAELAEIDIANNPRRKKEQWALQDKAYTALGYSYLAEKKYAAAIREFTKVRLDGIFANQALLGYGWAAVAQEEYDQALRPWQLLRSRSLMYPAVQESLLALPYAYEKLNAQGEAVTAYQTAEELLDQEIQLIRDMRATLTEGELLTLISSDPLSAEEAEKIMSNEAAQETEASLTAVVSDDGQNWLKLDSTSIIKTRSAYLSELFAKNTFQTAVLDLRDLLRVQKLLQQWQPKLDAYYDLLEQKQIARGRQEQQLAENTAVQKTQELQATRERLVAQLTQISQSENYMALADEETRALYRRIEQGQRTIARMKAAGQNTSNAELRLKMFGGILLWRAAQDYPAQLAGLQRQLATIDSTLAAIVQTNQHIKDISLTSMDIQPTFARLQVLQKEVESQLASTNQMISRQSGLLRQQVDQQLAAHEKRLNNYLAQAHLAVARLYDAELRKQPE
jgi:hypothetical protein